MLSGRGTVIQVLRQVHNHGLLLWLGSDATGMAEAKDLFLATLPIGSGILAYWFAARGRSSSGDNDK